MVSGEQVEFINLLILTEKSRLMSKECGSDKKGLVVIKSGYGEGRFCNNTTYITPFPHSTTG